MDASGSSAGDVKEMEQLIAVAPACLFLLVQQIILLLVTICHDFYLHSWDIFFLYFIAWMMCIS